MLKCQRAETTCAQLNTLNLALSPHLNLAWSKLSTTNLFSPLRLRAFRWIRLEHRSILNPAQKISKMAVQTFDTDNDENGKIRSKDGRGLDGEFLKEGALCSLLCHEPVALARASVVAKNHEILVIPGTLVKNRKLDIIHPNPKKLIELWLKEKMAAHCNSALSEIILHEFEVRTTLEE